MLYDDELYMLKSNKIYVMLCYVMLCIIKLPFVIKSFVLSFLSGCLRHVLLY